MDYRITDYGAVADGTTNNRAAIQAAVAGGGRVIVPIGQFLSGTIVLKSNVTLYLERGGRADQQSAQCCQNMLLFYVEYIGKKFRSCQSISGKRIWSRLQKGGF